VAWIVADAASLVPVASRIAMTPESPFPWAPVVATVLCVGLAVLAWVLRSDGSKDGMR
jgi:hypothetical protein